MFTKPVGLSVFSLCAATAVWSAGSAMATPLAAPFDTPPANADSTGASSNNDQGMFFKAGTGPNRRFFLGTSDNVNIGNGKLILDFAEPFEDGDGDDFALLAGPGWGELADTALIEFFLGGALQGSIPASLSEGQLFTFEMPGVGTQADRVVISNTTPDPAGVNDLATMVFDNAGAVPEPTSLALLGVGGLLVTRRRRAGV